MEALRQEMHGADDKIEVRRVSQQRLHMGGVPLGVPQLHAEAQLNLVPQRRLRRGEILCQGGPVIGRVPLLGAPHQRLHMVGKANFIHARVQRRLCHFRHGGASVRGKAGVRMVISQIHLGPHFLNLRKNLRRSS